jgi:hypothetical protein
MFHGNILEDLAKLRDQPQQQQPNTANNHHGDVDGDGDNTDDTTDNTDHNNGVCDTTDDTLNAHSPEVSVSNFYWLGIQTY